MGIRVNKMVGYGIHDLRVRPRDPDDAHSGIIPDDPRWNYEKYLADWCTPGGDSDPNKEWDLRRYLAWCEAEKERLVEVAERELCDPRAAKTDTALMLMALQDQVRAKGRYSMPDSGMQWDNEFGIPKVLLFIPPEYHHQWRRHDDIIDYYEEHQDGNPRNRVNHLRCSTGIYPHDGWMRRVKDPSSHVREQLAPVWENVGKKPGVRNGPDGEPQVLPGGLYNRMVGRRDHVPAAVAVGQAAWLHLLYDWRPVLPMGVLALIECLGCFPDAHGPQGLGPQLRPLVYVRWG